MFNIFKFVITDKSEAAWKQCVSFIMFVSKLARLLCGLTFSKLLANVVYFFVGDNDWVDDA